MTREDRVGETREATDADADGRWRVVEHPSGVRTRTLIEPSQAFLDRQATVQLEEDQRRAAQEAARQAKVDAIRNAGTVEELKAAFIGYLGIE